MKQLIWLSYDLGVGGDYEGLYSWLDDQKARECGNGVACMMVTYDGTLLETLRDELMKNVSLNKKSRIYVTYKDGEKRKGRFIFGRRKQPPWEGYGEHVEQLDDEG